MNDRELKLILAHINDDVNRVLKDHKPLYTSFYDPYISHNIEALLNKETELSYLKNGGFPNAERTSFLLYPSYIETLNLEFIQVIKIKWRSQYYQVDHRDILGALLGLGIKREKIGDIIVGDGVAFIFTLVELVDFIRENFKKASNAPLTTELTDKNTIHLPEPNTKLIRTTVATPRIDSIISACFGLSRSKTIPYILGGDVRINFTVVTKPDAILNEGDILSIRGMGRGKVKAFGSTTKKDRMIINLERYL